MPLFFDRSLMPARPKAPTEAPGLNDAHAEMNAARQVYNILNMLKRPGARERTIEYVWRLLGVDEDEALKAKRLAKPEAEASDTNAKPRGKTK